MNREVTHETGGEVTKLAEGDWEWEAVKQSTWGCFCSLQNSTFSYAWRKTVHKTDPIIHLPSLLE